MVHVATGGRGNATVTPPEQRDGLLIRADALRRLVVDRPGEGRRRAEALADEAAAAGVAEAEVVALRSAAWAARELYDHEGALDLLERAAGVAAVSRLDGLRGEVMVTRSAVLLELGDLAGAGRAVADAGRAFAPDRPAELVFAQGLVAQKAGRTDRAVAAYGEALSRAGPGETDIRIKAANNLGELQSGAGRLDEAAAAFGEAVAAAAGYSTAFGAIATQNLGSVAVARGRLGSAAAHYERAEDLAVRAGMPLVEFRLEQVAAFSAAGLWPEAAARLAAVVDDLAAPGAALLRADAALRLAEAAHRAGDPARARDAAEVARHTYAAQGRSVGEAAAVVAAAAAHADGADGGAVRRAAVLLAERDERERAVAAWLLAGRLAEAAGDRAGAREDWGRAADLSADGPVLLRASGHLARALAAEGPGRLRACRAGLDDLDGHRDGVASVELRARLSSHGEALWELALETLPAGCRGRRLLRWLEAGRALGQVATEPGSRRPELAADLAALRAEASAAPEGDDGDRLIRVRRLEDRVRRRAWTDGAGSRGRWRLDVDALAAGTGDDTLVSYGVVRGELTAVRVGDGRVRRFGLGPVAPVRAAARGLAFAARRLVTGADPAATATTAAAALARLDGALVAPVLRGDGGSGDLVVVPAGGLTGVPYGALASAADRPVRVVPSVRTWLDTRGPSAAPGGADVGTLLVAGPGLPGAAREVDAVAARRPGALVRAGPDATCAGVAADIGRVGVAHLACHGSVRSDAPMFSGLHLADGPFSVHDLEQVDELADIVILAACDAGLLGGEDSGAEGLGFLTALLQRGARAVVAATIPVPDLDGSALLVDLHAALIDGCPTAEALWRARRSVDRADPIGLATSLAFGCFGGG